MWYNLCRKEPKPMSYEQKVLQKIQDNNGIITANDVRIMKIPRYVLSRMVEKGLIEREKHGLYILPSIWGDEYYNLIFSSKNVVFSHATALYLHNFCERVPLIYDITAVNGYNASLRKKDNVMLYTVNRELFELGKIEIKSPQGKIIPVYDIERSLCDIVKDKDKQDIEVIKYAYKSYIKDPKKNIYKLMEYAKKLKVEDEVNSYLEVLL